MKPVYFINVFGGIDCTEREDTAEELYLFGNYFEKEADAIAARARVKEALRCV